MPKDSYTLPNLEWAKESEFGYCPVCHTELTDSYHAVGDTYTSRLLYCRASIAISHGDVIINPWDPILLNKSGQTFETTDGHFHQRLEEEVSLVLDTVVDKIRRWDMRIYLSGEIGYEICYITTIKKSVIYEETSILRWARRNVRESVSRMTFNKKVKFDISPKKIKNKIDKLLLLS